MSEPQCSRADPVVILALARTPLAPPHGALAALDGAALGAVAVRSAVARARLQPAQVDALLMAGVTGGAVAACAGLAPALCDLSAEVAGSEGAAALLRAVAVLCAGHAAVVVAGGVAAAGSSPDVGVLEAAHAGEPAFAAQARQRAQAAAGAGAFTWEIVPVARGAAGADVCLERDMPAPGAMAGAAALVLSRQTLADQHGWRPFAAVPAVATGVANGAAAAGAAAVEAALALAGWRPGAVDVWEIDATSPADTLALMQAFALPHERVNVNGGIAALGRAGAATVACAVVTLAGALRRHGRSRGVMVAGLGADRAVALALELRATVACGARGGRSG